MKANQPLHRTGAKRCAFMSYWSYYVIGFGGRALSAPVGELNRSAIMKRNWILIVMTCSQLIASGQEIFQFTADLSEANVVPPSMGVPVTGTGLFSFDGTSLSYEITTQYLTGFLGGFYGPAGPGENGPFIAPTTLLRCRFGPGGVPNYCLYQGVTAVSGDQVQDLMTGLWYVQLTSRLFPDLAIRGQVVPVPEPTHFGFFLMAIILWYGIHRWRELSRSGRGWLRTNAEPAAPPNGRQALRFYELLVLLRHRLRSARAVGARR